MTPDTIRAARARLGLTMPQFARAMGVTERNAYAWISGESKMPLTAQLLLSHLLRRQREREMNESRTT